MTNARWRVRVIWTNGDVTFSRFVDSAHAAETIRSAMLKVRSVAAATVESWRLELGRAA